MELTGQLHAPAALIPLPTAWEAGLVSEPVRKLRLRQFLSLPAIEPRPRSQYYSHCTGRVMPDIIEGYTGNNGLLIAWFQIEIKICVKSQFCVRMAIWEEIVFVTLNILLTVFTYLSIITIILFVNKKVKSRAIPLQALQAYRVVRC
jgi:hypothetical protein